MENIKMAIDYIAGAVEMIGVLIILIGIVYSLIRFVAAVNKPGQFGYIALRQSLGKSILLGLEVLIAADIMATIVTEPTLQSVAILGVIVLIRTVLSLSLQVELEGRFPWQKAIESKQP